MHDLVIRGGTVVDGTGGPARTADVAISDGTITEVGRVDGAAARELDADGLVVTPGFVDIHTHFDGQVTWDDDLTPSCWHGVTTAVLGNCGVGFAPVRPDGRTELIELMEGVEDIPGSALSEGIRWSWESFPEYLDALAGRRLAIDVGTHIPHAAVRAYVMGEQALDDASEDQLAQMCDIVRDGLRAGALGFSTGRTAGHRDSRGNPVPGTFAPEDELAALLAAMDDVGTGVLQVVPAGVGGEITGDPGDAMERELEWLVRRGVASDRPITFLVMERPEVGHWRPWFDAARRANERGANLRPQVGNRCFGVLMGHQSKLNPFQYRPTYRDHLAHLPLPERVRRMRDPEVRARILGEEPEFRGPFLMDQIGRRALDNVFALGDGLEYEPAPDTSIRAIAARRGLDPWEVAYDVLLDADGHEFLLWPLLNYGDHSYDGLLEMMEDPISVHGLGDSGAHVSLVCDASTNTYMLSHWVRDRTRGRRLALEHAVRRLTADPAALYGLGDRGLLAPGMRADVNVVDLERLGLVRPEQVHDLPGGAGRLVQRARGYVATFVHGVQTIDHDQRTDALPGRLVRGAR
ncbi:MAG TPA: amidohydrolase family protein [Acidimicrobiales bacterium]|nr:amidohydrolase family protein [Acidimicrobiales bacterium]